MQDTFTSFQEFRSRYPITVTKETMLGSGSYGKVIKVEDQVETEWVAIKISEVKADDAKSLQAEVELAKRIPRNVNIARYDACYRLETDTGLNDFAVMKYYPDGNLADLLRMQTLTPEQIYEITKGILQGLKHLHSHRIVHRDFKPANILISRDKQGHLIPKIADFGLSKLVTEDEIDSSDFDISDGRGTASYKAPEQFEGGKVSFNLDLWAFGVILFEILAGRKPFTADGQPSSEQALKRQIEKKIVAVAIPPDIQKIPEPYQAMIRRCLVKDIRRRVRKEDELLDLLDRIPQQLEVAQSLWKGGKFEEALLRYEAVLKQREHHPQARQGVKLCREGITKAKLDALLREAKEHSANGCLEQSIQLLEDILSQEPAHEGANNHLRVCREAVAKQQKIANLQQQARELLSRRNFREAKSICYELQTMSPSLEGVKEWLDACEAGLLQEHIDKLLATAVEFTRRKQYGKAISNYNEVLSIEASNEQARQQLIACREAQKQEEIAHLIKKAEDTFRRKQYPLARDIYGQVLTFEPEHTLAKQQLTACEEAIRKNQIQEWLQQANKLLKRQKFSEAQELFQQVLVLDSANDEATTGLTACLKVTRPMPPPDEETDVFLPSLDNPPTDVFEPRSTDKRSSKPSPLPWHEWAVRALPYGVTIVLLAGGCVLWLIQKEPESDTVTSQTQIVDQPKAKPYENVASVEAASSNPSEHIKSARLSRQAHDKAMKQATQAFRKQQWALANAFVNDALQAISDSREARVLQTNIQKARQQQSVAQSPPTEGPKPIPMPEREGERQRVQKDYNDLIEKGIEFIAEGNNKTQAISLFAKAAPLADANDLSTAKAEAAYTRFLEKGNRLLKLEEYAGAREWFKVAQSLRNTPEVRNKIKECDTNL